MKFTSVNPVLGVLGVPGSTENFLPTLQPKWTTNLSAEYRTPPVIGDSRLAFRIDASWPDKVRTNSYTVLYALPQYDSVKFSPARWLINTRVSLDDVQLFSGTASLAVWAKNLNNTKVITFPDILGGFVASTEFEPARTYGLDVTFNF